MNQFVTDHPWITVVILLLIGHALTLGFRIINRCLRHLNIRAKGWPPAHCDADGDFREPEKEVDSQPRQA